MFKTVPKLLITTSRSEKSGKYIVLKFLSMDDKAIIADLCQYIFVSEILAN